MATDDEALANLLAAFSAAEVYEFDVGAELHAWASWNASISGRALEARAATEARKLKKPAKRPKRSPPDRVVAPVAIPHVVRHPAKFTPSIIKVIAELVPAGSLVLDPFAGCGGIHKLRDLIDGGCETVGIELEPEWAREHPGTLVGSALALPFRAGSVDVLATSPCYGNRFADHHKAADASRRRSYTFDIGRTLHPDNAGAMQWGQPYRDFHEKAWTEARRVLTPGGLLILNISNHIRAGVEVPVTAFHVGTLERLGFELESTERVGTARMRYGANASARVTGEFVLGFRAPGLDGPGA